MENDRAGRGGVGDEVSSKSRWSGNHQHPTAPPTISMTWQARAIRDSFVLIIVAHKIIILEGGWLFAKSWTYLGKGFKCISFSYIYTCSPLHIYKKNNPRPLISCDPVGSNHVTHHVTQQVHT